jgi:hypothetical protein
MNDADVQHRYQGPFWQDVEAPNTALIPQTAEGEGKSKDIASMNCIVTLRQ